MSQGFPELPEGYFWRVTEIHLFRQPIVQLRKQGWIRSHVIDEQKVCDPYEGATWETMTRRTAGDLFRQFKVNNAYAAFMARVEGDYPPKSAKEW